MIQSLERATTLPITFDPMSGLVFWPDAEVSVAAESVRSASEMAPFQAEPGAQASHDPIYRIYRNVTAKDDAASVASAKLRYDITVIFPGVFSGSRREFLRTAGHYHPRVPGGRLTYPEVYEVLFGRAYWLIQRPAANDPAILEEIYAVEAGPGEKAVIPPGFGHISVNAFAEPLVIANWIHDTFPYDYRPYRVLRGAGFWMLDGGAAIEFEPNQNYRRVPDIQKLQPKELPEFGLIREIPGYTLAHDLTKLKFLSRPDDFETSLAIGHCYRKFADQA